MAPIVIETAGLKKIYEGKVPVPVLHGLDIRIAAGEFVAIMGQSGSGKSTLLNILGALDVATAGTVAINGANLAGMTDDELARLRNEEIGFIFQAHFLLDEFTCFENALMPLMIRCGTPSARDRERVRKLLDRVGLSAKLDRLPDELSGGERQRCAIVRALANQPKIILADEPTGNLDSTSGERIFALMREMNRETRVAFVMVTHDDRLARRADRILYIRDGLIRELGRDEIGATETAESDALHPRGRFATTLSE